jgi:hypothetical protein
MTVRGFIAKREFGGLNPPTIFKADFQWGAAGAPWVKLVTFSLQRRSRTPARKIFLEKWRIRRPFHAYPN